MNSYEVTGSSDKTVTMVLPDTVESMSLDIKCSTSTLIIPGGEQQIDGQDRYWVEEGNNIRLTLDPHNKNWMIYH